MRTAPGIAALFAWLVLAPAARADEASDDFAARCAGPDVVKCVGFDNAADIAGGWGDNSGILPGATTPALDPMTCASGASSLLLQRMKCAQFQR
jgi:hypothetical protein